MKALKQYGDCEGPLGFPMRSESARAVEAVLASVPEDCKAAGLLHMVKSAAHMDFSDGERADVSFITTEGLDRDNEVVLAKGIDFTHYRKNPTVTFAHKYDVLPVGRSMWLKREVKNAVSGWLAKTQYIERPENWSSDTPWFPDAVWHYVRTGNLPGKSIGFIALEMRPPTEKELEARPELASARRLISKSMALEYAVCALPCNPDALVQATAKARQNGIKIPDLLLEELGMIVPDDIRAETKPSPHTGETRADYIHRCVPVVLAENTARTPAQAVAICSSMWEDKHGKTVSPQEIGVQIAQAIGQIDVAALVRDELNKYRGRV